jgi:hypothetical protein
MDRLWFLISPSLLLLWSLLAATIWFLFPLVSWVSFAPLLVCLTVSLANAPGRHDRKVTARLAGLTRNRNDFCRGWLITGDTGAGKTFAINTLLHSVFQNEPDWGGLCCDEKGIYHETLVQMTKKYGRLSDLRLLQTKPDGAGDDWEPPATFNLLSDDSIPGSTYATVIVDTASALAGGGEDKGFFKTQAHAHISRGIQLFRLLGLRPTMHHLLETLQYQPILRAMLSRLDALAQAGNREARECSDHFLNGYLRQPPEQLGGVISTIYNYLNYFTNPDLVQVFGAEENSFEFSDLDDGAIICIAMPQKYQTERRYITTILKLLFYTHALRRFDPRPPAKRPLSSDNLLICWQDEAQRFVGESDGNVDVIRQANTTTVLAAQSKLSFIPPLGSQRESGCDAPKFAQPNHFQGGRPHLRRGFCRLYREKNDVEEIVHTRNGKPFHHSIAGGRIPGKTIRTDGAFEVLRDCEALRKAVPQSANSSDRSGRKNPSLVPTMETVAAV